MNIKDDSYGREVLVDAFRDSGKWNLVKPRSSDVIIASCYKSGTTLVQQMLNLLLHQNEDFERLRDRSPWVESRRNTWTKNDYDSLKTPRLLKTHLPFKALPYYEEWKYIYLIRDGRDVVLSLYDHCQSYLKNETQDGALIDNGPANFNDFWDQWLIEGKPRWSYWDHLNDWWKVRKRANILFLRYDNLIHHKRRELGKIVSFLDVDLDPDLEAYVMDHSSLQYMKSSEKFANSDIFEKGSFVNKGVNGRWRSYLSHQQIESFMEVMNEKLTADLVAWVLNAD